MNFLLYCRLKFLGNKLWSERSNDFERSANIPKNYSFLSRDFFNDFEDIFDHHIRIISFIDVGLYFSRVFCRFLVWNSLFSLSHIFQNLHGLSAFLSHLLSWILIKLRNHHILCCELAIRIPTHCLSYEAIPLKIKLRTSRNSNSRCTVISHTSL